MKKQTRHSIQISEPCHESWNQMTTEAQGRFCASCSKIVTDFSHMTDHQIIDHLSKVSGTECGRFTMNQLNRPLTEVLQPSTRPKWLGMAAATLGAILLVQPVIAFNYSLNHAVESRVVHHKFAYPLYLEFSGVITDAENGAPIPFAKLRITASGQSTVANADGTFYLKILTEDYQENPMISITSKGFENAEFDLSIVQREMEISLKPIQEIVQRDSAESKPVLIDEKAVVHLDVEMETTEIWMGMMEVTYCTPGMGGVRHSESSPAEPDLLGQFWNAIVDLFPKKY